MPVDPAVLEALAASVDAAPDNVAVRSHLAELLLDAGRPADALQHAAAVLSREPNHPAATDVVRRASAALAGGVVDDADDDDDDDEGDGDDGDGDGGASVVRLRAIDGGAGGSAAETGLAERPDIRLDDVGGMEHVKQRLRISFLAPMQDAKLRALYGKSLRGGLLLYGPPGCGKTFIARAVAGELDAQFLSVGLSDVLDMWLGESERRLHELFATARRHAPCVVFFDEIDALGQKRSHLRHSAGRGVVNQLLAELDGVAADNEGVFVLAATNHPWDVDTALRRPGRFDRSVLVLPPDVDARRSILEFHLRGRPVEGIDLYDVA